MEEIFKEMMDKLNCQSFRIVKMRILSFTETFTQSYTITMTTSILIRYYLDGWGLTRIYYEILNKFKYFPYC